jgi:hypothetical protein
MFISQGDVEDHLIRCRLIVGARLGIDVSDLTEKEFLSELKIRFTQASTLFARFTGAYRSWYAFHVRIEKDGKSGKLNEGERIELHQLITERDESRKALLRYLDFVTGMSSTTATGSALGFDAITQEDIDSARRASPDEARDFLIRSGVIETDNRDG